ncbi:zinc finger, CCHC-type containing protein [Tanacetum coccineum]
MGTMWYLCDPTPSGWCKTDALSTDFGKGRPYVIFQFSLRDQASNWLELLPAGSISTWEDLTTRFLAQFFPPGRTKKLHEGPFDYKDPNIERLLGFMEHKVDMLMNNAISLMRRSESFFGISSNMMHQLPPEPSRQEAFEDLMMNFILDQEERVQQLEEYTGAIVRDFMQLSAEVVEKF